MFLNSITGTLGHGDLSATTGYVAPSPRAWLRQCLRVSLFESLLTALLVCYCKGWVSSGGVRVSRVGPCIEKACIDAASGVAVH